MTFRFSTSSRVKIDSYSRFDQPPLLRKLGVSTKIHFEHSLSPVSMLCLKLSPTLRENLSNQTVHLRFCSSAARGSAIAVLSRLSCEMNSRGLSCLFRSVTYSTLRKIKL